MALENKTEVVVSVLLLLRDALRGSDRGRFDFRFEDGARALGWLLHVLCEARPRLELFRAALQFAIVGTGFDTTLVDPEALGLVAMNDNVWREGGAMAWSVVSELLPWLATLVHPNNRHRVLNFALLQSVHVLDWVLSTMILLVADPAVSRETGELVLSQGAALLEALLRCDLELVPIVFNFVLVTLSSTMGENGEEAIVYLLKKTSGLEQVSGGTNVTLGDFRCALLDIVLRLRTPGSRRVGTEEAHRSQINALYLRLVTGDWVGAIIGALLCFVECIYMRRSATVIYDSKRGWGSYYEKYMTNGFGSIQN
jgi:hypothetical protein